MDTPGWGRQHETGGTHEVITKTQGRTEAAKIKQETLEMNTGSKQLDTRNLT